VIEANDAVMHLVFRIRHAAANVAVGNELRGQINCHAKQFFSSH
jgi:hypothetical protein